MDSSKTNFTNWYAYQKGEELAQQIFLVTQSFPKEERYSLTDQIRRSSRSVCSNLAESQAKRPYPKHFRAKLTDAIGENNETLTWLRFARRCNYIDNARYKELAGLREEIGKLLGYMQKHPEQFGVYQK